MQSAKNWLLAALIIFAPLGTRYVFNWGGIAGAPSEYGTISLWATQILALAYVGITFWSVSDWKKIFSWSSPSIQFLGLFFISLYASALLATNQFDALQHADWITLIIAVIIAIKIHQPSPVLVLRSVVGGGVIQSFFIFYQAANQQIFASKWLGVSAHLPSDLGASVIVNGADRWLRAYGTFSHPNIAGFYLALALVAGVILFYKLDQRSRPSTLVLLILITIALVLTFSRSAWLAALLGLGILFWQHLNNPKKTDPSFNKFPTPSPFVAIIATAAIAIIIAWPLVHTRTTITGQLEQQSVSERVTYTQDAVALIRLHPFLGVGPGQMPAAVHDQLDPNRDGWSYQPVHNLPLLLMVELGTIGTAILIFLIFQHLKKTSVINPFFFLLIPPILLDHYLWSFWPGILLIPFIFVDYKIQTDP